MKSKSPYMNIERIEFIITYNCTGKCKHCSVATKSDDNMGSKYVRAESAVKAIENILGETGIELIQPGLSVKYVPDENEIKRCYEYGRDFARKIKG